MRRDVPMPERKTNTPVDPPAATAPGKRLRRLTRRAAVFGLVASVVPLLLWAVPATHPPPATHVLWIDHGGDQVVLWAGRRGFDRHGWVQQERTLTWDGATPAALAEVRTSHPVDLPPADSWKLQFGEYGNDHVYLPHGLVLTDGGTIRTLPYGLMAAALGMPAALWGLVAGRRRLWRRGKSGLKWIPDGDAPV